MIDKIILHLKGAPGSPFKMVHGSLSLALAQENPAQKVPAAWVFPSASAGIEVDSVSSDQVIMERIGLAIFMRSENDPVGDRKMDQLQVVRDWSRKTLIGYVPDRTSGEMLALSRGYLADFNNGGIWWVDEFQIKTYHQGG